VKVLFACTSLDAHGGIQRFNRNLLRAWQDFDVQVDVVALNDKTQSATRRQGTLVYGSNGSKRNWLATLSRLLLVNRYEFYVCGHIHLAPALVPLLELIRVQLRRRVLILHGIEVWDRTHGMRGACAKRFGKVLAVSNYTAQSFLTQSRGVPASRVTVFPNTISPELRARAPRERVSSEDGSLRLLSVTRLDRTERDKGVLDVLEALRRLPADIRVRYCVVGDGDDRHFLQSQAAQHQLAERVWFRGSVGDDELWRAYEEADVFVLPSRKEGFGIVFLEAMRFGLPVIAASEKGAVDVVRHGENGFLVPFGDAAALAARLLELSRDDELRKRLGKSGRRLVEAGGEFSFEAFRDRCRRWLADS
jgi:phosphatidyl-myo-inositol dimannoside synthase